MRGKVKEVKKQDITFSLIMRETYTKSRKEKLFERPIKGY